MVTRRRFLQQSAGAAASVFLPAQALGWGDRPKPLSKGLLDSLAGQSFRCVDGNGLAMQLALVEVTPGPETPGVEQFTAVFEQVHGADNGNSGGLTSVYHPETGATLMYLEPSARGTGFYVSGFGLFT